MQSLYLPLKAPPGVGVQLLSDVTVDQREDEGHPRTLCVQGAGQLGDMRCHLGTEPLEIAVEEVAQPVHDRRHVPVAEPSRPLVLPLGLDDDDLPTPDGDSVESFVSGAVGDRRCRLLGAHARHDLQRECGDRTAQEHLPLARMPRHVLRDVQRAEPLGQLLAQPPSQ
ncbi:hypothetical protein [Streptomyces kronopolitis]